MITDLINTSIKSDHIYFKMNMSTKRFISFKELFINSYAVFPAYGFLQRTLMFFSSVVFGLYRGHCFDGYTVSFDFMIDS